MEILEKRTLENHKRRYTSQVVAVDNLQQLETLTLGLGGLHDNRKSC